MRICPPSETCIRMARSAPTLVTFNTVGAVALAGAVQSAPSPVAELLTWRPVELKQISAAPAMDTPLCVAKVPPWTNATGSPATSGSV